MAESITIKTELLAAIARYSYDSSDRADRPHLAQVVFRDDEVVATNGHILVRAQHPTKGQAFGVPRDACFAGVAAQDALARHYSDFATRLGLDLEASSHGESIVVESPHGNRELRLRHEADRIDIDIGDDVVLRTNRGPLADFPPIEQVMVSGGVGDAAAMGFSTRYLDALDVIARAAGYYHRGCRVEAWDAKGPMQWLIPQDVEPGERQIRVVIMRMKSASESKAPRRAS